MLLMGLSFGRLRRTTSGRPTRTSPKPYIPSGKFSIKLQSGLTMKKVLVVFDTTYGNTEKLGREIASGIEETGLAECKVINIEDVESEDLSVYDGALFGGPIHAFRATRGIKNAVKTAAKKGLNGKLVSSFDTYQAPGHKGKAAKQIEDELRKKAKGAKIFSPGLTALVLDRKGPLKDDEPTKAREFGQRFAQELAG